MFLKGIVQGSLVLIALVVAMVFSSIFDSKEIFETTTYMTVYVGWIAVGYFYKKHNGGFFSALFSGNTAYKRQLFQFTMGADLIWAPIKLYLSGFPAPDVHPLYNAGLILLSIPMTSVNISGGMLIGGFFYKDKS